MAPFNGRTIPLGGLKETAVVVLILFVLAS